MKINKTNEPAATLAEIDKIFNRTMKKLSDLHRQKMILIKRYYDLNNQKELKQLREKIKKS